MHNRGHNEHHIPKRKLNERGKAGALDLDPDAVETFGESGTMWMEPI